MKFLNNFMNNLNEYRKFEENNETLITIYFYDYKQEETNFNRKRIK